MEEHEVSPVRTVREVLADVQRRAGHAHRYSGGGTKDLASAVFDLAEMVRIVYAQLEAVAAAGAGSGAEQDGTDDAR